MASGGVWWHLGEVWWHVRGFGGIWGRFGDIWESLVASNMGRWSLRWVRGTQRVPAPRGDPKLPLSHAPVS